MTVGKGIGRDLVSVDAMLGGRRATIILSWAHEGLGIVTLILMERCSGQLLLQSKRSDGS